MNRQLCIGMVTYGDQYSVRTQWDIGCIGVRMCTYIYVGMYIVCSYLTVFLGCQTNARSTTNARRDATNAAAATTNACHVA